MIIEPGKFYKTRDGRKVRIYATDGKFQRNGRLVSSIHGAFLQYGGIEQESRWLCQVWLANGRLGETFLDDLDIIAEWAEPHPLANAKPGDVVWVRDCDESTWAIRLFMELNIS
ncbi:MAG: hypothetical protein KGL35_07750, partial [Bradyrhizobium sp.]|nr:hypothetical protein [Bradyrhizobium sp.]